MISASRAPTFGFAARQPGLSLDRLQFGKRLAGALDFELVEAARLRHHPAFEAADEIVVALDRAVESGADAGDVIAHRRQPA